MADEQRKEEAPWERLREDLPTLPEFENAATAAIRGRTLVTCDRDHVRLAPDLPVDVLYLQPPV